MRKETGGPAFPVDCIVERDEKGHRHGFEISSAGLTIRDYFAAKAMQGLLSSGDWTQGASLVDTSYRIADDMLECRK